MRNSVKQFWEMIRDPLFWRILKKNIKEWLKKPDFFGT